MSNRDTLSPIILYYGEDASIIGKLSDLFGEESIHQISDMKKVFEFMNNFHVTSFVFETFQMEPFRGVNGNDLDILLYYASSQESNNKHMSFLPIDPTQGADFKSLNLSSDYYEDLYKRYLYLLPGLPISDITPDSILLPDGLDLLSSLVGILDDATEELDTNLERISFNSEKNTDHHKTSLNSSEEKHTVKGLSGLEEDNFKANIQGEDLEKEESQIVSGFIEEEDDTKQVISGSDEEDKSKQVISGSDEEDKSKQVISGSDEEDKSKQVISGSDEEDKSKQVISGSDEEDDSTQVISGSQEDLKEEIQKISGFKEEEDKTKIIIKGDKNSSKPKNMVVSSNTEEINDGVYELKKLAPGSQGPLAKDDDKHDINDRNDKGQTPIMLFAYKGEVEKVKALLASGADPHLLCHLGKTVLHYACYGSDDLEFIKELVETHGLKANKKDSSGRDPFYEAIISNHDELLPYLLENGARLLIKYDGEPVLILAAKANALKSFKSLLLAGADLAATNDKNENVIKYCKSKKKLPFLKIIAAINKIKDLKAS
ncbi:MAG: ankyrin repeat domain-containing protein [Bacteriovoracaceae bacterium]|nr:ankyrin repeat domain-containing protein [Bacteriovoracaceae bacterium]